MKRPAFNMITLVIYTVAVIMLTGIALYGANEYLTTSKIADTKSTAANYATAVSQYRFEIGEYPDSLSDLTKEGDKDVDGNDASHFGPWINKIEKDAWDRDFVYETLKTGGDETGFVIYSKGSDNAGTYSNKEFKNGAVGIIGK
jgi:general secretion pathway protein G